MDYSELDRVRRTTTPLQLDAVESFARGRLTRREFIKRGTVVGLSMASISAEGIDGSNILKASLEAMRRAVAGLSVQPKLALADGRDVPPGLACEGRALISEEAEAAELIGPGARVVTRPSTRWRAAVFPASMMTALGEAAARIPSLPRHGFLKLPAGYQITSSATQSNSASRSPRVRASRCPRQHQCARCSTRLADGSLRHIPPTFMQARMQAIPPRIDMSLPPTMGGCSNAAI